MLALLIILFVLAVVAALFGFTNLAVGLMGIARILFFVLVVFFVIALVLRLFGIGVPPPLTA
jgi:uncharacterized membrane protein YtjA (UPF0391 family)